MLAPNTQLISRHFVLSSNQTSSGCPTSRKTKVLRVLMVFAMLSLTSRLDRYGGDLDPAGPSPIWTRLRQSGFRRKPKGHIADKKPWKTHRYAEDDAQLKPPRPTPYPSPCSVTYRQGATDPILLALTSSSDESSLAYLNDCPNPEEPIQSPHRPPAPRAMRAPRRLGSSRRAIPIARERTPALPEQLYDPEMFSIQS